MVSLATVDPDAALRAIDTATALGRRVIVEVIEGSATAARQVLDSEAPPTTDNDMATEREREEWAAAFHDEAAEALEGLTAPPLGTVVDVGEAVVTGVRQVEAISLGAPADLVLVTTGFEGSARTTAPIELTFPEPGAHPAAIWLVGIGDYRNLRDVDRSVANASVGTAGAICGLAAPRPCTVLASLDATPGGS